MPRTNIVAKTMTRVVRGMVRFITASLFFLAVFELLESQETSQWRRVYHNLNRYSMGLWGLFRPETKYARRAERVNLIQTFRLIKEPTGRVRLSAAKYVIDRALGALPSDSKTSAECVAFLTDAELATISGIIAAAKARMRGEVIDVDAYVGRIS